MARKTIFEKTARKGTTAGHYKDGARDIIKIGDLRVLITQEGPWWFAQGLEIDYAAQGKSLEEVKEKFARGLCATAHAYILEFGGIDKFLRPAPADILRALASASAKGILRLSTESEHGLMEPISQTLPFTGITYFEKRREPAVAATA